MAMMHFHFKHHIKRASGGSGLAVRYLERRGEYDPKAAEYARYHERTGGKWKDLDDLRFREVANLPQWAEGSAERFFEAAAQYERSNGRWGTSIQASLPRELSREAQVDLTRTWIEGNLPDRPTLWVIHEPVSKRDGLPQPHVHILFSERLMNDGLPERSAEEMFRRYNPTHPEQGGAQKGSQGDRQMPARLRESWAASSNVYLAAVEAPEWMDPRSFQARNITRQAVRREAQGITDLETLPEDERTPETRAHEAALAAAWWTEYQRTMGLTAAHLRDPQAALTLIAREVREPGSRAKELAIPFASIAAVDDGWYQVAMGVEAPHLQEPHEGIEAQEQGQEVRVTKAVSVGCDQPLIGNVRSKIYHAAGDPNYGDVRPQNQVLFWSLHEAQEAGYRAAVNQHHGRGAKTRMEVDVVALEERIARLEQYANDVDQARQGHPFPPSKLVALLAGRELEESTGKGLTMKLYEKDEGYGR